MSSAPGQAYEASATYQRVITLLSPEQLQLVLAKGWEALDHSPVFSTDAGTCIWCTLGGSCPF